MRLLLAGCDSQLLGCCGGCGDHENRESQREKQYNRELRIADDETCDGEAAPLLVAIRALDLPESDMAENHPDEAEPNERYDEAGDGEGVGGVHAWRVLLRIARVWRGSSGLVRLLVRLFWGGYG